MNASASETISDLKEVFELFKIGKRLKGGEFQVIALRPGRRSAKAD
jgi:hypothetical protein